MRRLLATSVAAAVVIALAAVSVAVVLGPASAQDRPAAATRSALQDGPYLFHEDDGSVTAKWVKGGRVETQHFDSETSIELPQFASLLGASFSVAQHVPDAAIWEQPEQLLVLSDVEGRYTEFLRFLTANGVVDGLGGWAFGKGHVVCVGDMVDRGSEVTETLWLMYRLAREAKAAGGMLHHVLGNHEAMLMGGDTRYVAPKYKEVAALLGVPCEGLVGADTELGRWMRTRNSIVRIGAYLFVHAGISPAIIAGGFDLDDTNTKIRSVLGVPPSRIEDAAARERVWGRSSVLWYRGYFPDFARDFGPTPTASALDDVLDAVGAKAIVVGHTKVRAVTPLHGGRVIAVDVPWTNADNVRGLLIRRGGADVIDIRGARTPFVVPKQK